MKKILITGGTGLIGRRLSYLLTQKGYEVRLFSRTENLSAQYPTYHWNPTAGTYNETALSAIDAVINLAGAGVADKRWSWSRKKEILDSRIHSLVLLNAAFQKMKPMPKVFISTSAIGYYGDSGEKECFENTPYQENDFLSETCKEWEAAVEPIEKMGIRTCTLRVGVVLSKDGGALAKMLPSYKANIGAYFGDGSMYYSWIHIDDICNQYIYLLENESGKGIYNGVAPNPVTNKELAVEIGVALDKKVLLMPVPIFALKLGMGEMAAIVTNSCRVSSEKIQKEGYVFQYPLLKAAMKEISTT